MGLDPGTLLGHYEILSSLGAGGMGEVYRARDTKLGREVAIKLLLAEVSEDPERLARFEREAHVLASLNHPNIATLHGFESEGATNFLVMELVEGETLAERIQRGAIALEEALPLFLKIAEGLAAAHEKGVVHRDLKPANIKVTEDGSLKILDFGLAKAVEPVIGSAPAVSESPTLTLAATMRGEILGTAAYMSPEQARGEPTDPKTDIWAFGVCLYEALVGRGAFASETAADSMAKILQTEPDWEALPGDLPFPVLRLLRRCLTKDGRERLQHIGDARLEILEALDPTIAPVSIEATPADPRGAGRTALLTMGIVATLALGLAGWAFFSRSTEIEPIVRRLVIDLPPWEELSPGPGVSLAVSGDGRTLVYVAGSRAAFCSSVRSTLSRRLRSLGRRVPEIPSSRQTANGSASSPEVGSGGYRCVAAYRSISATGPQ